MKSRMRPALWTSALLLLPVLWGPCNAAGDPAAGRQKAGACRACHGIDGLSRRPDAPHIAGQTVLYMEEQLRAFRSGRREHAVMSVVAANLSDADIADLAAWYASIEVTVRVPE